MPHSSAPSGNDSLLASVIDSFRARRRRGENPQPEEYAAKHPQFGPLLLKVLSTCELLDLSLHPESVDRNGKQPPPELLSDFRLLRELGRGGMGVVYEAYQLSMQRRVALKVLPMAAVLDERQLARFKNETLATACLKHPNIVTVYGIGCENGIHYYSMEFVEGRTLAELISERRAEQSALPGVRSSPEWFRWAATVGIQAAEALAHAHDHGVVHRDVKPSNLLVESSDRVLVADFGLARIAGGVDLTLTGDLVGTLRYMSPEQALGQSTEVDHRSDVYSLGATLYELLTLEPMLAGSDRSLLLKKLAEGACRTPRKINPQLPADLENIVLKAVAHEKIERYESAQDLADDLQRFLDHRPVHFDCCLRASRRRRLAG